LSRGDADQLDQSIQPEDMANQSFRLKEEQLKKEEEKLKEIELRVQREISEKRQELLAKEESLRNMEVRLFGRSDLIMFNYLIFFFSLCKARLAHASSGPLDG
jgi:hypothetical protein